MSNNGLNKNSRNFTEMRQQDNSIPLRQGNSSFALKDCVIVGVKGIGTFKDKNYGKHDEGGVLFDVILPEGKTLNYLGRKVRGIRNIRCRNTYEELQLLVGCLEKDFIGHTVDLEYSTSNNYNSIVKNGQAVVRNRTKRSNFTTGMVKVRQSLYGDCSHMGCLMGTYEHTDSVQNKLMESHRISKLNGGLA